MKKLKVLVIDKSPIIFFGLKSIFKNSSFFEISMNVEKLEDLNDILDHFKIDLIISEINFKNGNIYELLKRFKKNKIDIPLVVFTSKSNEKKSVKLLKDGCSGFITKDLRKKFIIKSLQEIAFSKYDSKELNKFTRLKNRFNYDYNIEKLNSLSKRELQVLKLFFRGKRNIEISKRLEINQKTVNTYVTRVMKKLEVNSKTDLYLLAKNHIKQPY